jgi:hypothetical protein
MFERIIGIFKLDVNTFEEIEKDTTATSQAAVIVAIVAVLVGLGSGFTATMQEGNFFLSFISTLVWTFIGWLLWAVVSWFVGTKFFGGQATLDEMLRVIGFAYSPQLLGIIPCIGGVIGAIWSLIAGFIAVRQGLDLDNLKAALTILIGFAVYVIGIIIISAIVGGASALVGLGGS